MVCLCFQTVRNIFEKFSFDRFDSKISRFTASFGFLSENGIGLQLYSIQIVL